MERYALYFSLTETDELFKKVDRWFNPGAGDGAGFCDGRPSFLDPERHEEIVATPRGYGFHGTLKPPFALASRTSISELEEELADYCFASRGFDIGTFQIKALGSFLALVPTNPNPLLKSLASELVVNFDRFRAPQSPDEENKRRKAGLTQSQENNLVCWGYPYVLDEFRFHMTLTSQISDQTERSSVQGFLEEYLTPELEISQRCDGVHIFRQPDRMSAFERFRYLPFG